MIYLACYISDVFVCYPCFCLITVVVNDTDTPSISDESKLNVGESGPAYHAGGLVVLIPVVLNALHDS